MCVWYNCLVVVPIVKPFAYRSCWISVFLGGILCADPAFSLTYDHEVIVAYYPIFPRWGPLVCDGDGIKETDWLGDPLRQYPLLGLYDNKWDQDVNFFDFQAMANAGVTGSSSNQRPNATANMGTK